MSEERPPEQRDAHETRVGVYATRTQVEQVVERIALLLRPDPEHRGPCRVPWGISGFDGDTLIDGHDDPMTLREFYSELVEQYRVERNEGRADGLYGLLRPGPAPVARHRNRSGVPAPRSFRSPREPPCCPVGPAPRLIEPRRLLRPDRPTPSGRARRAPASHARADTAAESPSAAPPATAPPPSPRRGSPPEGRTGRARPAGHGSPGVSERGCRVSRPQNTRTPIPSKGDDDVKVTRDQVLAWRLRRQFVDPRGDAAAAEVVGRLCGVQAQVASAAETAVGTRQRAPDPAGIGRGLADGSLLRIWAMRGTLHLLRSAEAPAYLSLIAAARTWTKPVWQRHFGATPQDVAALADAVTEILDGRALTREELVAELLADRRFHGMAEQLRSGWGALLKPLAWQGVLCHAPGQGSRTVFARPADLVPHWRGLPEPDAAAPVVIAAYLGAHGPATPEAFDAWLTRNSLRKTLLRRWFEDMGEHLTRVEADGRSAYLLAEHADELADGTPSRSVRLLGAFDQYVLGPGTKDTWILPAEHRSRVSRRSGWISPVVVVGGRIRGVWELADDEVVVSLFPGAEPPPEEELAAEAAHLARISGRDGLRVRTA